jgi:hypothetical protein
MSAKDIIVKPISPRDASAFIKRVHYSGSTVNNSNIHFGVFLNDVLGGVLQFGSPMDKRRAHTLVEGTNWNGMLELNRMAFTDLLPKNSESRAISICLRTIKKTYPFIEWVVSYADGTQCGDGTIYRASGFALTGIKKNTGIIRLSNGEVRCAITFQKGKHALKNNGRAAKPADSVALEGFQLRYIYFLNPKARVRLTVPVLPFSEIARVGAGMYKGKPRAGSKANVVPVHHTGEGGATPTPALQPSEASQ